jgi:hypothetical protein
MPELSYMLYELRTLVTFEAERTAELKSVQDTAGNACAGLALISLSRERELESMALYEMRAEKCSP